MTADFARDHSGYSRAISQDLVAFGGQNLVPDTTPRRRTIMQTRSSTTPEVRSPAVVGGAGDAQLPQACWTGSGQASTARKTSSLYSAAMRSYLRRFTGPNFF